MAKLPIEYHPEARSEVDSAFDYYRERNIGIAEAFYLELERADAAIRKSPESWAAYLYGTRRYLLEQFPFVVVYRMTQHRIEVLAVAHGHRKPGYWADRLK
jgi:plasmid stabilization system protein ParE